MIRCPQSRNVISGLVGIKLETEVANMACSESGFLYPNKSYDK